MKSFIYLSIYIYIYIYITKNFEAPTIFHISTIYKKIYVLLSIYIYKTEDFANTTIFHIIIFFLIWFFFLFIKYIYSPSMRIYTLLIKDLCFSRSPDPSPFKTHPTVKHSPWPNPSPSSKTQTHISSNKTWSCSPSLLKWFTPIANTGRLKPFSKSDHSLSVFLN